ncbi:hypothetical protein COOONC_25597, partial [Cooperia oncophora]
LSKTKSQNCSSPASAIAFTSFSYLLSPVFEVSAFVSNGSSLDSGWTLTKGTLELLAEIHVMLVKNLQDLAKEVAKYKEDLVKARKEAKQQDILDAVNLMQTTTTCLQKSKETYYARCAELEKLKKEANVPPKEITKVVKVVACFFIRSSGPTFAAAIYGYATDTMEEPYKPAFIVILPGQSKGVLEAGI